MFIKNGKRFNIHTPVEVDGFVFASGDILKYPEFMAKAGITETPDPQPPEGYDEALYYRTEQDDAPYVVYTRKSDEQILQIMLQRYETALDGMLDKVAREHRYNDRFTFALRAGYAGPYQAEGIAFAAWMDGCNTQAYALMEQVAAGTAQAPEPVDAFLAIFPPFVKP